MQFSKRVTVIHKQIKPSLGRNKVTFAEILKTHDDI